ncbi:MAG: MlaD family protein [Bacteroidales bacterium]|jgi:phospholipid/cholesterol/gamma-HCH transport system substrate-binding protein|nr:MlaD family protein [Bacteroidales bacterium]
MKKYKKELQIGITTLIALIVLFFGINYLKGNALFSTDNTYYAIYNSVSGLHASNYIYINGMKVGFVKKIERVDVKGQKFLVEIAIDNEVKIPVDSKLVMYSSGLLGGTEMRIDIGNSLTLMKNKDTINAIAEMGLMDKLGSDLKPTIAGITAAATHLDSVLTAINQVLDRQAQENIKQSLENIKTTTNYLSSVSIQLDGLLEKEKARLSNILSNVESIATNLNNNSEKLNNIITNFNNISDTLAQAQIGSTLRETNQSLTSVSTILHKIESGEGNLGMLINDDQLYKNLDNAVKKLDALIEDIKANPKRYVKISVF